MSVVSPLTVALQRKRLTGALIAVALCMLTAACGNDDAKAPDTSAANSTDTITANDNGNPIAVLSANPASVAPAPAALTIQSPALPASSADPALSSAASTPLVTPVIHTVD